MKGWLLCFLTEKPVYDLDSRKLVGSDDYHPFLKSECAHYFYAACTQREGKMSITWAANAADQKIESLWNEDGSTDKTENLAKYMSDANDYHIVIGPRHRETSWATSDDIGAGKDYIWENCDYYVGRKKSLLDGVEGQNYFDFSKFQGWEDDDAKFAVYYFDNNDNKGWSEFATSTSFENIYVAQYSLDFVPTASIAVRLKSTAVIPNWDDKHNQSDNLPFYEYGVFGVDRWKESWEEKEPVWSYEMASVRFSENDKVALDHLKRNDYKNSENFNQGFPLTTNQTFDIYFAGAGYSEVSFRDSSIAANFDTTSVSGKIKVLADGIYALYFNTDAHTLYITTPAFAKADEWSITFLGDGCASTKTKTIWDTSKYNYKYNLDSAVQDILKSEPHVSHDTEVSGYVALAIQRYDFLVENFEGFDDFMGRATSQNIVPYSSENISLDNAVENDSNLIIIIVASITLVTFTSLIIVKKKRAK